MVLNMYGEEYIVILITTPNIAEAEEIVNTLLKEKLIACANIVEKVKSRFWWKGEIEESEETLIIIKTLKGKLEEIYKRVREKHSYTTPEIIAIPIIAGYEPYLKWISEVVNL